MPYAILRFQKRKAGGVAACERHNERKKEAYKSNPDIDMERSKDNYHLVNPPRYTYKKEINRMVAEAGCRTRKDSVMMVETLITASPEFMNSLPPKEQKAYFTMALDFISERVGEKNILSAVVHMDERTPHMHLCFVPITPDNKLSAKTILGNQKSLSEWQTAYHERMSSRWNQLERGQSSMETKRKHVPTWLYKLGGRLDKQYEEIVSALSDINAFTRALKGRGIEVFFVDDNIWTMDGDGELRLTIMATLAQEESRKVSERVRAGQRISRANKQLYGSGNILGYDRKPGETYTINPEQAETVRMIYDLYEEGYGTLKIAKILMERKRLTATGTTKWTCHNVGRILQNATYKGYIGYNKSYSNNYLEQKRIHNLDRDTYEYVKGDFEPIITEKQWDRCQAILKEKRKTTLVENGEEKKKSNRTSRDIWVKKLRCSCGSSFRKNRYHKNKDGVVSYNYVCYNQVNNGKASQREKMGLETDGYCNEHSVTDWKMEMMAKYFLNEAWKNRKEDLMIALEYIKKYYTDATRNNTQHSELFLDAQIDKAERKLKNLIDLFTDGQISKEEFAEFKATYSADLQKFKDEKARCGEQQELFESCMCDMTAVSQALAGMVDMSSPEYTSDLFNEIVNSILVENNRFIWNFSYNKNANTGMNISVDGTKRCPVISIDGEIMGTPSGVPDFLHISEDNSLNLPAEIRNNPLFAKNLSLILHLHRLR